MLPLWSGYGSRAFRTGSVSFSPTRVSDGRLEYLGAGEREALALAIELDAMILADDRDARVAAVVCGVRLAGTLRVLESAAAGGLVGLEDAFEKLRATSFRAAPKLYAEVLERAAAKHKGRST